MKINAIQCLKCKDIIYSRARHDMHSCSCGATSIDGGFDYCRISYKKGSLPRHVTVIIKANEKELYEDWDLRIDKYGLIKKDK